MTLPLSHRVYWVKCGTWLYRFLTFAFCLTYVYALELDAMLARRRKAKFPTGYPTIYLPKWKFWIQLSPNLISGWFWKEKKEKKKSFSLYCFHGWATVDFGKNWQMLLKLSDLNFKWPRPQTACLVVNPITVDNFSLLFKCTPVVQILDSLTVPT